MASERKVTRFNEFNTEINNQKLEYYLAAYNEKDIKRQDYYLMRVFHTTWLSQVSVDEFWGQVKFSFFEDIRKMSDDEIIIFNENILEIISLMRNKEPKYDYIYIQTFLLFSLLTEVSHYFSEEIFKIDIIEREILNVNKAIKVQLFDKGYNMSYLSKCTQTILIYLNPGVTTHVFKRAVKYLKNIVRKLFLERGKI